MSDHGPELWLPHGFAGDIASLRADVAALARAQAAPLRFTQATVVDREGNPMQVIGAQPDGTAATRNVSGPTPPSPQLPTLTGTANAFRIITTGKPASREFWPADVQRIEVHTSLDGTFAPTEETAAGDLGIEASAITITATQARWYVRLVAVTTSGQRSVATEPLSVLVKGDPAATIAQQRADEAIAAATAAEQAAAAAEASSASVTGTAAAAQQAADAAADEARSALAAAQAAGSDVGAAQAAADNAASAAVAAQAAADAAGTSAADADAKAANAAAVAAQAVADAAAADAKADGAQSAADAAQASASNAASAAATASSRATAAQASANGKNRITHSVNPPGPAGTTVGDTWFQRGAQSGLIQSQYEWTGGSWAQRQFDSAILAYLDAGKITTGTLTAGISITIGGVDGGDERLVITGGPAGGIFATLADGSTGFALPVSGSPYFRGTVSGSEVRSNNFSDADDSSAGFRFSPEGEATLQDINVTRGVSTTSLDTSELTLKGRPLAAVLEASASRLVAIGYDSQTVLSNKVEEAGICELAFTAHPNRGYRISINGPEYGASNPNTVLEFRLRFTQDGSTCTPQSPNLKSLGHFEGGPLGSGAYPGRFLDSHITWFPDNQAPAETRLFLTIRRALGDGKVGVNCRGDRRVQISVEDVGPRIANSLVPNYYENPQPGGGGPAAPPPGITRTREDTMYATWGRSYEEGGGVRYVNGLMYQGVAPGGFYGNQRSLFGFNQAYVQSRLAAGSMIRQALLFVHNRHTYSGAGGVALIGSHNFWDPPGSFPFGAVRERRASVSTSRGGWSEIDVTGVVSEMVLGQSAGFAIGAAPNSGSDFYAYFDGVDQGSVNGPRMYVKWDR